MDYVAGVGPFEGSTWETKESRGLGEGPEWKSREDLNSRGGGERERLDGELTEERIIWVSDLKIQRNRMRNTAPLPGDG